MLQAVADHPSENSIYGKRQEDPPLKTLATILLIQGISMALLSHVLLRQKLNKTDL